MVNQVPEMDLQLFFPPPTAVKSCLLTLQLRMPGILRLQHHFFIFMSASMAQRRPLVPPSCSQGKQTQLHNPTGTSLRHSRREGGREGGNSASGNNFLCLPIRRKGSCPCQGLPADLPKAGSGHSRVLGLAASLHCWSQGRERQHLWPRQMLSEPEQCRLSPKQEILA